MSADAIARLLNARRSGRGKWRAQCPVHKSRGLTLSLAAGKERLSIYCHAGCKSDDVLATLGLTWKDTLYDDKRLTPAEKKAWAKKKYIAELYAREQRMQDLKLWMNALRALKVPVRTQTQFERDIEAFCASVLVRSPQRQK